MTDRPIIDAGPALNFFSINRERFLLKVLGKISAPETVEAEVGRKAQTDKRFQAAATVWKKLLAADWVEVLSDNATPDLAAAVNRIGGLPMIDRMRRPKDLGEIMVVAHAAVAAEAGHQVIVLIDDSVGARLATSEIKRLDQLRKQGRSVGSIVLINTLIIVERAITAGHLPDKAALRDLYQRLRGCDDGLPPIGKTQLLSSTLWRK